MKPFAVIEMPERLFDVYQRGTITLGEYCGYTANVQPYREGTKLDSGHLVWFADDEKQADELLAGLGKANPGKTFILTQTKKIASSKKPEAPKLQYSTYDPEKGMLPA